MDKSELAFMGALLAQGHPAANHPRIIQSYNLLQVPNLGDCMFWTHGRAMANHSKYSPQAEDRKHNFINRRSR